MDTNFRDLTIFQNSGSNLLHTPNIVIIKKKLKVYKIKYKGQCDESTPFTGRYISKSFVVPTLVPDILLILLLLTLHQIQHKN